MAERNSHSSNALLAPLIAGMVGAGLALLLAPRSGKETREKIRDSANNMKSQAEENLLNARDSLEQSIQHALDLKQRLTTALTETGGKARRELDELKDMQNESRAPRQSSVLSTWEEEV